MVYSKLKNRAEFAELAGVSSSAITHACKGVLKPAVVGKRIDADHSAAVAYLKSKDEPDITATGYDPYFEDAVRLCVEKNKYSIRFLKTSFSIGTTRASKIVALMKVAKIIPEPGEPPPKIKLQKKPQRTISGYSAKNVTKKDAALQKITTTDKHEVPENMQIFADMTLRELIESYGTDVAFLDWLKAIKELENIEAKRIKNAEAAGKLVNRDLVRTGIIEPINNAHIQLLTDGAETLSLKIHTMVKAGEDLQEIKKSVIDQMSSFIRPVKDKIARALNNA